MRPGAGTTFRRIAGGVPLAMRLPPPDPFEPAGTPPGFEIPAPTTVFLMGRPSREHDRLATAILAARPGLSLLVCHRG